MDMITFEKISDYNDFNNHETLHPLVSVIDFSKAEMRKGKKCSSVCIVFFLKM